MGVDSVGDGELWLGDVFQQRLMFSVKGKYLLLIECRAYAAGCADAPHPSLASKRNFLVVVEIATVVHGGSNAWVARAGTASVVGTLPVRVVLQYQCFACLGDRINPGQLREMRDYQYALGP